MSGIKGGYGAGGSGKVDACQDTCAQTDPCQTVAPAPVQCKAVVDPCQENQSGGIGGGYGGIGVGIGIGGGIGGQGGQVSQSSVEVKK